MRCWFTCIVGLVILGPTLSSRAQTPPPQAPATPSKVSPTPSDGSPVAASSAITDPTGSTQATALFNKIDPCPHDQALQPAARPRPTDPLIVNSLDDQLMAPLVNFEQSLFDEHRLAIDAYYTLVYQYADPTVTMPNSLLTGRLDLGATWDAIQIEDVGTGQFQLLIRAGQIIGEPAGTTLSGSIGALTSTNALNDPNDISVNVLSWTQGLAQNKYAITIGKLHPNQYIDLSPVANDESRQFLAGPFDGNNAIPLLGTYSSGLVLHAQPQDLWYVHAMVIDSLGTPSTGPSTLDQGKFTTYAELGLKPVWHQDLQGQFRFIGFYSDNALGNGSGFAVNFDLTIDQAVVPFVRYAWNSGSVAVFEQQLSVGLGLTQPFNRTDDMIGVAVAWSDPGTTVPGAKDEALLEVFYRLQLTKTFELTPDLQLVTNQFNDLSTVLGLRVRANF